MKRTVIPNGVRRNRWVVGRLSDGEPSVRLICFPHAGGSAGAYAPWRPALPSGVELAPVELPGRGTRVSEPPLTRRADLIDAVIDGLAAEFDGPYALFGHSIGGLIAYELAVELQRRGRPAPLAVLVSGSRPPHVRAPSEIHRFSDPELLDWLRETNGLPADLLRHESYVRQVVSAIRADAGVAADSYRTEPVPLACPLHVFGAHDDPSATPAELEQWDLYEGVDLTLTLYPGDHFYLYADPGRLLADIASVLAVPPA